MAVWNLLSKRRNGILLLLVGVFLPLWGFGKLAEEIWEKENGFPWDVPLLLLIHQGAKPQLDFLASALTQTGGFWSITTLSLWTALILLVQRRWRSLTFFIVAMLGNGTINRVAKLLLQRVRPHLWDSPAPEFDYGFPSGHAMASMGLVVALIILSPRRRRKWAIIGGAFYVLMIAWTRLYLGVHYPSDVAAGWMASIAWVVGMGFIFRMFNSNRS
jgi:undecaprenyl-diphosphatase